MEQNLFGNPVYQVKLPGFDFEGPLDLLLQLIERNELPVTEISLATIAEEYASYINQLTEINPAELSEFLVISAKLLLIKSAALLPAPVARPGEPEAGPNEAEELLAQLREYKRVKEAARFFQGLQEQNLRAFPSQRTGPDETLLNQLTADLEKLGRRQHGLHGIKLADLVNAVRRRIALQQQQQLKLPLSMNQQDLANMGRSIKIEDRITLLETRLTTESRVSFSSLFDPVELENADPARQNLEVIVTFMAVLELLRRRSATASQDELFGEIYIERNTLSQ